MNALNGDEPITSMWIEDKRQFCRILDVRQRWKDLASQRDLQFTQNDVILLDQSRAARGSPTEELLDAMYQKKRTTMRELCTYLAQANLLSAMEIVKKYIPMEYHIIAEPPNETLPPQTTNPIDLIPSAPPPLPGANQLNLMPQELTSPAAFPSIHQDDSILFSMVDDLSSTQIRAGHTIIATRNFAMEDIRKATDDFSDDYLLSPEKGVHSSVYKVVLQNTPFAAKVYNLDYNSVLSDLQDTRHHNHENIVPVTGKCLTGDKVVLLYELMASGSLRGQLDKRGVLSMDQRARILLGAARGLQYLHSNKPPLLHRNIKSKNILLDNGFKAKLSDFGLAVHANKRDSLATFSTYGAETSSQSYTHFSTREDVSVVQQNKGYCAREVVDRQKFSTKSDTYSFGVVMYEALTGLRAYDPSKRISEQELVNLIENRMNQREDLWNLRDKSTRWAEETYGQLFHLAQKCTEDRPKLRPSMDQVYKDLVEIIASMPAVLFGDDDGAVEATPSGPACAPLPEYLYYHGGFEGPTFHPFQHHLMAMPSGYHAVDIRGQSLPAGGYHDIAHADGLAHAVDERYLVEPQAMSFPQIPLVQTQISASSSSMSELSLSLPLSEGPASTPNLPLSPNVVHRQTVTGEYIENPSMLVPADYSEISEVSVTDSLRCDVGSSTDAVSEGSNPLEAGHSPMSAISADFESTTDSIDETPGDLFEYLLTASTAENTEDGADLDPALLEELNNLDIGCAG